MYTFVFLYILLLLLYNKFVICVITYVYVHVYTCIIYARISACVLLYSIMHWYFTYIHNILHGEYILDASYIYIYI